MASGLENNPANRKLLEKEIVPEMVKKLKAMQSGESFESSLKIKLQKVEDFGAQIVGLKLPKRITPEREILPFSKDEINIILQNVNGYFVSVIAILIFSGIRPGELAVLEWGDVSFETKEININKTLKRGGVVGLPKISSSRRIIAMLKLVESYPREQYRRTGLKGGLIFENR